MGENSPILVGPSKENPQVKVKINEDDVSVGSSRYTAAKQISRNLALKPNGKGLPGSFMPHANIEVELHDKSGHIVPMTKRFVRHWYLKPDPNAVVFNLDQWKIEGLQPTDVTTPFAAPGRPAQANFKAESPGKKDAPGYQMDPFASKEAFGQLQEFIVGNPMAGGAYFQVYTLDDGTNYRVLTTRVMTLSIEDYEFFVKQIETGAYSKTLGNQLFFMPGPDDPPKDFSGAFPPQ